MGNKPSVANPETQCSILNYDDQSSQEEAFDTDPQLQSIYI